MPSACSKAIGETALTNTPWAPESIQAKIKTLTPREREVLTQVVAGLRNKQIARDLGRTEKTVKVHCKRVMTKLGVRTLADLVRMVEKVPI